MTSNEIGNNYQVVTSQNRLLIELLNDDTFVAWVKGGENLPRSEKKKWDDWHEESIDHAKIAKQAKKILGMPFNITEIDCNSSGELERFLELLDKE